MAESARSVGEPVAQLVEQRPFKPWVLGSNPSRLTIQRMFYKIGSTRVGFREYYWGTRSPLVLIGWLIKLLRIRLPSSTDDPAVDSVQSFKVAAEAIIEPARRHWPSGCVRRAASG